MLSLVFVGLLLSAVTVLANNEKIVVCYYGTWAIYRPGLGHMSVDQLNPHHCTHLMYAFAGIDDQGTVISLDPELDLADDGGRDNFRNFTSLKNIKPSLKTILAVGGWNEGSAKYSVMANNATLRQNFIQSGLKMVQKYNFDGLDLDWEYPNRRDSVHGEADIDNFTQLLKELKEEFDKHGLLVSVAVSAVEEVSVLSYNVSEMSKHVDWVGVMTYDMNGSWDSVTGHNSPLHQGEGDEDKDPATLYTVDMSIQFWLRAGCPPEKLVVGLPLYGRTFTLASASVNGVRAPAVGAGIAGEFTGERGFLGYNEFCVRLQNESWTVHTDEKAKVPYAFKGTDWVSFDNPESLTAKIEYALNYDVAGIMVWSIETDDFHGLCGDGKYPLLRSINKALYKGPRPTPPASVVTSTIVPIASTSKPSDSSSTESVSSTFAAAVTPTEASSSSPSVDSSTSASSNTESGSSTSSVDSSTTASSNTESGSSSSASVVSSTESFASSPSGTEGWSTSASSSTGSASSSPSAVVSSTQPSASSPSGTEDSWTSASSNTESASSSPAAVVSSTQSSASSPSGTEGWSTSASSSTGSASSSPTAVVTSTQSSVSSPSGTEGWSTSASSSIGSASSSPSAVVSSTQSSASSLSGTEGWSTSASSSTGSASSSSAAVVTSTESSASSPSGTENSWTSASSSTGSVSSSPAAVVSSTQSSDSSPSGTEDSWTSASSSTGSALSSPSAVVSSTQSSASSPSGTEDSWTSGSSSTRSTSSSPAAVVSSTQSSASSPSGTEDSWTSASSSTASASSSPTAVVTSTQSSASSPSGTEDSWTSASSNTESVLSTSAAGSSVTEPSASSPSGTQDSSFATSEQTSTSSSGSEATITSSSVVCKEEGFMHNPSDCSSYYICVQQSDFSLLPFKFMCPPTLRWDRKNLYCNYAQYVECFV